MKCSALIKPLTVIEVGSLRVPIKFNKPHIRCTVWLFLQHHHPTQNGPYLKSINFDVRKLHWIENLMLFSSFSNYIDSNRKICLMKSRRKYEKNLTFPKLKNTFDFYLRWTLYPNLNEFKSIRDGVSQVNYHRSCTQSTLPCIDRNFKLVQIKYMNSASNFCFVLFWFFVAIFIFTILKSYTIVDNLKLVQ